ncbi:MAG TPA: aspartate--tRNA ligase [Mycobacteriales bacterium]
MIRTHEAGMLRAEHAGQTVTLAGWVATRRDHGGVAFVDLRDASGIVQVVLHDEAAGDLRDEFCIKVVGEVRERPAGNENPDLPTGSVEVAASSVEVLSACAPLPFPIDPTVDVGEEARLRWRYLDLRRDNARALRIRAHATRVIRRVMDERGFVDVETPYLTRSTPEGARDFLVPVRLQPGHWYALPQSPQLFKQLLMVAGLERYYQIARCFRDEDFRADRQPDFTQLDFEMSFVDEDDVYAVGEAVITAVWSEVAGVDLPVPFRRMRFDEAMDRFGSDKPDLRFGMELADLSPFFADTEVRIFAGQPYVGAVVVAGAGAWTRKQLDGWNEWARGRGAKGLAYVLVEPDGSLRGGVLNALSDSERSGLAAAAGAAPGDGIFFAAGPRREAQDLLGAFRVAAAREIDAIPAGRWEFLWITDMPMFEPDAEGGWTPVHHPFTAPAVDREADFDTDPSDVPARAYDLVCNGNELASGSIRIHRSDVQQRVFDVIGLTHEEARSKFGFLLDAFAFGPPPHGGLAPGLDRIAALLAGADSIRDVIAFPKTSSGGDPLTGAPTPITAQQRKDAGIDAVPVTAAPASSPAVPTGAALPGERPPHG